jgi:8-oxo-dGTP pyrophosphatase MutT (NUDIX family)
MLKIFINATPLLLCNEEEARKFATSSTTLKGRFINVKMLHSYLDMLEKPHDFEQVVIFSDDFKALKKAFIKLFMIIKAAGGLVRNQNDEILFIFRRGFWDLPKGKIDDGEKKKQAAIREVQEETGIQNIDLHDFICKTLHVYTYQGKRILKKTYWYNMKTTDNVLIPQEEEGIEQAVWLSQAAFLSEERSVYKGILEVLEKA